jgi:hypothetical protein
MGKTTTESSDEKIVKVQLIQTLSKWKPQILAVEMTFEEDIIKENLKMWKKNNKEAK